MDGGGAVLAVHCFAETNKSRRQQHLFEEVLSAGICLTIREIRVVVWGALVDVE